MKMYGFWRSNAAHRVRIGLNLKGVAYEEVMVDLDAGEQGRAEYQVVNPAALVPTLVADNGSSLTQSLAILEYLDETRPEPPLLPADPLGRARVRAIALTFAADSHPFITPRVRGYLGELGVPEDAQKAWIRHWLSRGLASVEARLAADAATGRFCHGDTPTLADICLAVHANTSTFFGIDLAPFPVTGRIWANCLAIDAFARAQPLLQPGAPRAA
jgi:maleylacetoacetate isomerase